MQIAKHPFSDFQTIQDNDVINGFVPGGIKQAHLI
jgi:hypothetical protein